MLDKIIIEPVEDITKYDPLLIDKDAYFTQSNFYGDWQEQSNRQVFRFNILKGSALVGTFQFIKYPLWRDWSYLYCPHGPVLKDPQDKVVLAKFTNFIENFNKQQKSIFTRFDIFPSQNHDTLKQIMPQNAHKTPLSSYFSGYFQHKFEWVLPLDIGVEDLLKNMHPKTRYNIKIAQKNDIVIEQIKAIDMMKYFDTFYRALKETSIRGKFILHPKKYYKTIFESSNNDNIALFIAKYKDEILAVQTFCIKKYIPSLRVPFSSYRYGKLQSHI